MEYVRWMPRLWKEGTMGLTFAEKALYFEIINEIYLMGGPVKEDHYYFSAMCRMDVRTLRRTLASLIDQKKLHRVDVEGVAKLHANHTLSELSRCEGRMSKTTQKSRKAYHPPAQVPQSTRRFAGTLQQTTSISPANHQEDSEHNQPLNLSELRKTKPLARVARDRGTLNINTKPFTPSAADVDRASSGPSVPEPEGGSDGLGLRDAVLSTHAPSPRINGKHTGLAPISFEFPGISAPPSLPQPPACSDDDRIIAEKFAAARRRLGDDVAD